MANQANTLRNWTSNPGNPGDRVKAQPPNLNEKAQQRLRSWDITGDRRKIPPYFIVQPKIENQLSHHVNNAAEEISELIRRSPFDENGRGIELIRQNSEGLIIS